MNRPGSSDPAYARTQGGVSLMSEEAAVVGRSARSNGGSHSARTEPRLFALCTSAGAPALWIASVT